MNKDDVIVCAPAKDYPYDKDTDFFKDHPEMQSAVRGLVCSLCGCLVVSSEVMFNKYEKAKEKPSVVCGGCFITGVLKDLKD